MTRIHDQIPDAETVISLAPEELAFQLLQIARTHVQNGLLQMDSVITLQPSANSQDPPYPPNMQEDVEIALIEAWHWLELNAFLMPAPGINGANGFKMLSRRGRDLIEREHFDAFQKAAAFPKELLHPAIADRVWISLARGELDTAVFYAYRTVEEAVRAAGGYAATDIGVSLMRKAFDPIKGPLTDQSQPEAERSALAHLFAGAIGSYKNPHSHRTVTISKHTEAQEIVLLASHLLRIVDGRPIT